jgi:hypothetical protein
MFGDVAIEASAAGAAQAIAVWVGDTRARAHRHALAAEDAIGWNPTAAQSQAR